MSKSVNFEAINNALMAGIDSYLARWLPGGDSEANEYVALNPTRADTRKGSFRINRNTGAWKDFALSDAKGGDLISLYAYLNRKEQIDAAKELADMVGIDTGGQEKVAAKHKAKWEPILPTPSSANAPPDTHYKLGTPRYKHEYRGMNGGLLGYIWVFYPASGPKEIFPLTWCREKETGKEEWRWLSFSKPRPMYGLDKLLARPKANIILVEGEKAANAVQLLFPKQVVMTWAGGSQAVKYTDFSPIYGRSVILWPDNDKPGLDAMHDVAEIIGDKCEHIRFLTLPEGSPEGWDGADATWTAEEAQAYVKSHLSKDDPTGPPPPTQAEIATYSDSGLPYRPLGYDRSFYYYMASGTRTVLTLSLAQHNKSHLLGLAPLQYWEREFHSRDGVQWDMACNKLLRSCEEVGFFSPSLIRGRGAWHDEGRVAIHLGNKVLLNGEEFSPHKAPSKYIYEAGLTMRADLENPLSNKDAQRFAALCEVLPWEKPISSRFLAGWCVLAHIGGALSWRPHLWMIGSKGSGKTHVMSKIVKPLLGENCLFIQSASTAAGIRQMLAHDSLPVLFDEAEGEDLYAVQRMQTVLELVRQSSSDTGGVITKGTPTGKSQTFSIRSCFAFSSINASIIQQSDRSRLTILELSPDHYKVNLQELEKMEHELLTDEYIKSFYARALSLTDVIRKNAITFARAVGAEFGEQRVGDQIGALLAGSYSLYTRNEISFDDALKWVREQDWKEQRDEAKGQNDEQALWSMLMQKKIAVKIGTGNEDFPVGYLIEVASGRRKSSNDRPLPFEKDRAAEFLMRNGMRAEEDCVYVSNTSSYIQSMLKDTPWHIGWGRILKRLPGASISASPVYYGFKGSEARSVRVPLT